MKLSVTTYDTTRALFDGSVPIDGVDVTTAPTLPDIYRSLIGGEVDLAEFGLTFYLRSLDQGAPFTALPIFPNRVFRHSCVFVHADSGITHPSDLVGKTIGEFGVYGQDSGVWAKGILMDEYGFQPELNRWVIGGLEHPAPPFEFTSHPHPDDVELTAVPEGKTLSGMLESGEIDALFTANVPQPVLDGSPAIRRLFPNYESVERDYYRRTGIFPMMHAIAAPKDVDAGLARAVYDAFLEAKDIAADQYRQSRRLFQVHHMLPWTNALFEANEQLLPHDWWPYGVAANHKALDAFLRYHFEQGLSARRWTVEEVFAPELLGT
ncbi:4,5-dihydroxyphthalate decarboxylase [Cryptosporangium sp. NPDC048952]|uniref:4,5-dihydroxyphthalate decarboxylase n=1 Tax=Cryptosporangium sp. NPDC048952 TaxID=3363961 RepID=UPI00371E593E